MPIQRSVVGLEKGRQRPFIHLNCALLPDGRMGTDDGKSIPISCADDWQRVHGLRERCDGVAVGGKTWIGDRPRLTVRREALGRDPIRQPARIIFAGGCPCEVHQERRRTFVIGPHARPWPHAVHLHSRDRTLEDVLGTLHDHGIESLLVEGGPTLLRSFLDQGTYDQLSFYISTRDRQIARQALDKVFSDLPTLTSERFGEGTLLGYTAAERRGPEIGLAHQQDVSLLHGKLQYLDTGAGDGGRLVMMGPVPLPLMVGGEPYAFDWYVYGKTTVSGAPPAVDHVNSALVFGGAESAKVPLIRIHSGCHTGDVFASLRCDCGAQLEKSLGEIVSEGSGVAVYITEHEGRGIGLWAKAMAYMLQDQGRDTYEANRDLGYPDDARHYGDAAAVLASLLDTRDIHMLSNNPTKRAAFEAHGFNVLEMRGLVAGHNVFNRRYIEAKHRNGHLAAHSPMKDGE